MAINRFSDSSVQEGFPKYTSLWDGRSAVGSMDFIGAIVAPSAGAASITFSSIPATYTHLQLRIMCQTNRASSTGDDIYMNFNGSSATDYYAYHILYGDGTSALSTANAVNTGIDLTRYACVNLGASYFSTGIVDILDYTSTLKNKTIRNLAGVEANGTGIISFGSGLWKPATPVAITSITLVPSVGTAFNQYSSFALYGIK